MAGGTCDNDPSMNLNLLHNDQPVALSLTREGETWKVRLPDGTERSISARRLPNGLLEVQDGDRRFRVGVARVGAEVHVSFQGQVYVFEAPAEEGTAAPLRKTTGELTAPMPGIVVDVLVQAGDQVTAYQPLAVVEAMKVMATVESHFAGRVDSVFVVKGQRVAQGEKLVVVVPEDKAVV
jgi:biotin carboxyl carrier protein